MAQFNDNDKSTISTAAGTNFGSAGQPGSPLPARVDNTPLGSTNDSMETRIGMSPIEGRQLRQGWDALHADGTVVMMNPVMQLSSVAWLYCWKGVRKGSVKQLTQARNEFGRAPSCQLELEETYASDHHGALLLREGRWYIIDFASTNGTLVNQKKLGIDQLMPLELQDDDVIQIGESEYIFKKINKK